MQATLRRLPQTQGARPALASPSEFLVDFLGFAAFEIAVVCGGSILCWMALVRTALENCLKGEMMLKTSMIAGACFFLVGCSGEANTKASAESPKAETAIASVASKAAASSFAGTWGADAAECGVPQDMQGAPMILTEAGYDQHEAHCSFTKVTPKGASAWSVAGTCSVEGDEQEMAWDLSVAGDTLTIMDSGYSSTKVRCP
jgi:hypothetical protein